jgi:hypothetical protein
VTDWQTPAHAEPPNHIAKMNLTEIITGQTPARPYVKLHEPNPTNRPCLYWPAFLMRLSARGLIGKPNYRRSVYQKR